MTWSKKPDSEQRRRRRRRGAWAVLLVLPVWTVVAIGTILSDRQPPNIDTVAAGTSEMTLNTAVRRSTVRDSALYVTPRSAVATADCGIPRPPLAPEPINRSAPDRANTAERTVDGVTYYYYGKVYSLTRHISCAPGATGLLLTVFDGNHTDRNFAVFILLITPVLGFIALRVLLRPDPGQPGVNTRRKNET